MSENRLKITIFLASVRSARISDQILKFVSPFLRNCNFELEVIDPLIEKLPIIEIPYHYYKNKNEIPDNLKRLHDRVAAADGYIMLLSEYNSTIPPALSNIIDYLPPTIFKFKPVGIVTYSEGMGGPVCCSHICQMMLSMGCLVQPMFVHITMASKTISNSGELLSDKSRSFRENSDDLVAGMRLLCDQIQFIGEAMKQQSQLCKPPNVNLFF